MARNEPIPPTAPTSPARRRDRPRYESAPPDTAPVFPPPRRECPRPAADGEKIEQDDDLGRALQDRPVHGGNADTATPGIQLDDRPGYNQPTLDIAIGRISMLQLAELGGGK